MRAPGGLLLAALALAATGCEEDTTEVVTDDSSSSAALLFRLSDFLGDVPCSSAPGAMRSYVVTLVDRTRSDVCGDGVCIAPETAELCPRDCASPAPCGDGVCANEGDDTAETCPVDCDGTLPAPFTLPSSIPTPCSQGVRFDEVAGNHRYSVLIDGYEAFSGELGPTGWNDPATRLDALASGSRHMVDTAGIPVEPRWLGACGEGLDERTLVSETGTSVVLTCDPLVDTATVPPQTAILVDPLGALGSLACAGDAAEGEPSVATFDIVSEDGLGNVLGLPCSKGTPPQPYTGAALVPGAIFTFHVAAHAKSDEPPTWGAMCSAVVKAGLTVEAACLPLSDKGSVRVDMAPVLGLAEPPYKCGGSFSTFDVTLEGAGVSLLQEGLPCAQTALLGPLSLGEYTLQLTVPSPDGPLFSAACTAAVTTPGRAAAPQCTVE